jgi:hypothetical protein
MMPNQTDAPNPAMTFQLQIESRWRGSVICDVRWSRLAYAKVLEDAGEH